MSLYGYELQEVLVRVPVCKLGLMGAVKAHV